MTTTPLTLDLHELGEAPGLPALTPELGQSYANAAGLCLGLHCSHSQGVLLMVDGVQPCTWCLYWPPHTDQIRRTHNDPEYATEHGAYAIAILLAMRLTGKTVIEQSWKGTGFDYWLGDGKAPPFQASSRLEVSGILKGTDPQIKSRRTKKKKQTAPSAGTRLPAYVCVVEFSRPVAYFEAVP